LRRLRFVAAASAASLCVASGTFAATAEAPKAEVRGLGDKILRAEIQQALGRAAPPVSRIEARRRAREAADTAIAVLRSEGYYDYQVDADIGEGDTPQPFVTVTPGPRAKLKAPTIIWIGGAPDADAIAAAEKAMALTSGGPGRAAVVVAAEGRIVAAIQRRGYADADAEPREVIVDHADTTLQPTYRIKAGAKVRFDGVRLASKGRTSQKWVRKLAPWKAGEVYRPEAVAELERRLNDAGAFGGVTVSLAPESEAVNGERPVIVSLSDRSKGALELGASYSTQEGAGINSSWLLYNQFGLADTLTNTLQYAQIDSRLQTQLSLPDWRRPEETLKLTAALYRDHPVAYEVYGIGISADLTHRYGKTSFLSYGVSIDGTETDEEEEANFVTKSKLRRLATLATYGAFTLDRSDDPLNPTRGWKIDGRLQPTMSLGDGSVSYLKTWIQAAGYLPLQAIGAVLAARVKVGDIFGGDIPLVPAQDRFYAGGGGSVRGYGYQEVGPRFTDNNPEGGLSLFESSFEIRKRITEQWGAVAFLDAGSVGLRNNPDFTRPKYGAGIGVRYNLGFGPIRLDLATPLNPDKGDPLLQVYLSIGQSF
jgi:translocation and assembly module TamA